MLDGFLLIKAHSTKWTTDAKICPKQREAQHIS